MSRLFDFWLLTIKTFPLHRLTLLHFRIHHNIASSPLSYLYPSFESITRYRMPGSSSSKPSSDKPSSDKSGSRSESSNFPTSPDLGTKSSPPTSPDIGGNVTSGQFSKSSEKWFPFWGESHHAEEDLFSQWYSTSTQVSKIESQESTVRGTPSQRGGRAAAVRRGALFAQIAAWNPEQNKAYCLKEWGRETRKWTDYDSYQNKAKVELRSYGGWGGLGWTWGHRMGIGTLGHKHGWCWRWTWSYAWKQLQENKMEIRYYQIQVLEMLSHVLIVIH